MSASSTILHKRSSISGVTPSTSSLSAGEIAINTADGLLFTKTTDETIKTYWDRSSAINHAQTNFLPLTGGTLTGTLCATSDLIIGGGSPIAFFVGSQSVGINTETPNEALTVVGNISATGTIQAGAGTSASLYIGSSKVGINTESPTETLSISGNAEILGSPTNGLILSSPDGTRWRLTVTNTGTLSTVAV